MTNTNYTKEPWKHGEPSFGWFHVFAGNKTIAKLPFSANSSDEHAANARLIAAAPELVEALKEILEGAVVHNRQEQRITNYAVNLARAALKKAGAL